MEFFSYLIRGSIMKTIFFPAFILQMLGVRVSILFVCFLFDVRALQVLYFWETNDRSKITIVLGLILLLHTIKGRNKKGREANTYIFFSGEHTNCFCRGLNHFSFVLNSTYF
jgi:hypothetical protein